jgi:hypothetical protein
MSQPKSVSSCRRYALRAFLGFRITVMPGTADLSTTGRFFPKSPRSMRQGATRYERAHTYVPLADRNYFVAALYGSNFDASTSKGRAVFGHSLPTRSWRTKSHSRLHLEPLKQRLCFFEIGRAEAFGEPAVDRRDQIAGFGVATLIAAEPG